MTDMHMLSNLSMNIDGDFLNDVLPASEMNGELFKMLSQMTITSEVKMVTSDSPDYFMSYDLNYKTFPLITLDVFLNEKGMTFSVSNFYDESFSMNFDELLKMYTPEVSEMAEELEGFDYNKYLEIIKEVDASKIDMEVYKAFVEDHLKDVLSDDKIETLEYVYDDENFETEVTVVTYNLNFESIMNLISNVVEYSEEDSALKDYAQNILNVILKEMLDSEDYKIIAMEKEALETFTEALDTNFDEGWSQTFESISEELQLAIESLETPDESTEDMLNMLKDKFNLKLYMNKSNQLKKIAFYVNAEGLEFNYDIILHDRDNVTIDWPKETTNLMDLLLEQGAFETEDDRNTFIITLLQSVMNTLNEGEAYQTLIEDLEPFEEMLGMSPSDIRMALGMAGIFIEEMTFEDLKGMFDFGGTDDGYYDDGYYDDGYESSDLSVALITDGSGIFDSTFNQITYEGLEMAESMLGIYVDYYMPVSMDTETLIETYEAAIMSGFDTIVALGYTHGKAIGIAQNLYPDVHFILLDAQPLNSDLIVEIANNTVAVLFNEEEAGFLAGIASALESTTGQLGFIGGMAVEPTQNYGWGYAAGVAYANYMYNTDAHVTNYVYQGNVDDEQLGYDLAMEMYTSGVDILFSTAAGDGPLNASKAFTEADNMVYFVGSETDQYDQGFTKDNLSVVLTSAVKYYDNAVYTILESLVYGDFQGGQALSLSAENGGVGLPYYNANLSYETDDIIYNVIESMISREVVVPTSLEALMTFLEQFEYDSPKGIKY